MVELQYMYMFLHVTVQMEIQANLELVGLEISSHLGQYWRPYFTKYIVQQI